MSNLKATTRLLIQRAKHTRAITPRGDRKKLAAHARVGRATNGHAGERGWRISSEIRRGNGYLTNRQSDSLKAFVGRRQLKK